MHSAVMSNVQDVSVTGMTLDELKDICISTGEAPYRARQILSWVYNKCVTDFEQMTNLSRGFRKQLGEKYRVFQTSIEDILETQDCSKKFLVRLFDENVIECVLLREGKRITACVSTQVGCAMACRFCASGLCGLERNLQTGEIIEQVLHMKNHLLPGEQLTNVVFMGIGEPLDNYDNVINAVHILNAEWGLHIGIRHITVSTVGNVKGILRLAKEGLQINLAISLHAPDDATRSEIIPSNKKTGIHKILSAAQEYFKSTRRDISFEYTMIEGVNASRQHAHALARLLKNIQCNVNILPLNSVHECDFKPPSLVTVEMFSRTLKGYGLVVTVRKKKGGKLNAACGQLRLQRHKILWKKD